MVNQIETIDVLEEAKEKRRRALLERRGRFTINHSLIRGDPEAVMAVLKNVLVVQANYAHYGNAVEYCGYSMLFDPIGDQEMEPEYVFEVVEKPRDFELVLKEKRVIATATPRRKITLRRDGKETNET